MQGDGRACFFGQGWKRALGMCTSGASLHAVLPSTPAPWIGIKLRDLRSSVCSHRAQILLGTQGSSGVRLEENPLSTVSFAFSVAPWGMLRAAWQGCEIYGCLSVQGQASALPGSWGQSRASCGGAYWIPRASRPFSVQCFEVLCVFPFCANPK